MRISDSGQVAFWDDEGDYLYVGRKWGDRFGRSQFMQRGGQPDSEMQGYKDELANCDDLACRFMVKGPQREAGPVARRGCEAKLFDARVFKREGAQDVYLSGEEVRFVPANSEARRRRPWGAK